jgi:hypothetical protein
LNVRGTEPVLLASRTGPKGWRHMAAEAQDSGASDLHHRSRGTAFAASRSATVVRGLADGAKETTKTTTRDKEVNTMNTILDTVEEILDGIELEVVDMPVYDIPDYLPRMCNGGGSGSGC